MNSFSESEKSHGGHTHWFINIYDAYKGSKTDQWQHLKKYIEVRKFCTNVKTNKTSESIRLYMTNLNLNDAQFYHKGIRNHWRIENSLHWVKDVFHNEDNNRIKNKNGAINISIISSIAINLQRLKISWSIKEAMAFCSFNIKKVINMFRT